MSEDTTVTGPQAGSDGTNLTPQAGDTTTSISSQVDESHNKPSKSAEDYERMIAELRKENAGHRTKLKKFEEEEAKRTEAQLSKEQLLEKQYNELKTQHDAYVEAQFERMIDHEIGLAAAKAGVNPKHLDKISRLLDWEAIDIDQDSGAAKNIGDLVGQLVKDMPELLGKAAPTSGGATNPSRSQSDANGEITAAYVADVMSGKIAWSTLTPERRTAVLNWQSRHPYRF